MVRLECNTGITSGQESLVVGLNSESTEGEIGLDGFSGSITWVHGSVLAVVEGPITWSVGIVCEIVQHELGGGESGTY